MLVGDLRFQGNTNLAGMILMDRKGLTEFKSSTNLRIMLPCCAARPP